MKKQLKPGKINLPLLRKAIKFAEAEARKARVLTDPDANSAGRWNQSLWFKGTWKGETKKHNGLTYLVVENGSCDTAMCLAGNVAYIKGAEMVASTSRVRDFEIDQHIPWVCECIPAGKRKPVSISEYAAEQLGLDFEERERLFNGDNSIRAIRRIAKKICADHGQKL